MSNILVRSLTGAIFISLILFPLFYSDIAFTIIMGIFMALGLFEFYKLFQDHERIEINWIGGFLFGILLFVTSVGVLFEFVGVLTLYLLIPILFILYSSELLRKKQNPLLNAGVISLGILYLVVPFIMMVQINKNDSNSFPILAGMFCLIWMNDTFAYLSGRFFGKTKLTERISPNKTWEGTIGGFIFTIIGGIAVGLIFDCSQLYYWIISASIIAPCAIIGDLLESLFKRSVNVKDSGRILPGHGGILDRFDSTLFTVPFFLVWTYFYTYF